MHSLSCPLKGTYAFWLYTTRNQTPSWPCPSPTLWTIASWPHTNCNLSCSSPKGTTSSYMWWIIRKAELSKTISPSNNANSFSSNPINTALMPPNKLSKHLNCTSSACLQQQTANFHYNCGTNWPNKWKPHWTCSAHSVSIHQCQHTRPFTAHMTGTTSRLLHQDVRLSFTKHLKQEDRGLAGAPTRGMLVLQWITIDAIIILSQTLAHISYLVKRNCFLNSLTAIGPYMAHRFFMGFVQC